MLQLSKPTFLIVALTSLAINGCGSDNEKVSPTSKLQFEQKEETNNTKDYKKEALKQLKTVKINKDVTIEKSKSTVRRGEVFSLRAKFRNPKKMDFIYGWIGKIGDENARYYSKFVENALPENDWDVSIKIPKDTPLGVYYIGLVQIATGYTLDGDIISTCYFDKNSGVMLSKEDKDSEYLPQTIYVVVTE